MKPKEIWAIRFMLDQDHRIRDRALFDMAIDSKLRGCALVKIRTGDLVAGGRVRNRAMVIQQKTKRPVQFELLEPARSSILAWLERRQGSIEDFAFPSRSIDLVTSALGNMRDWSIMGHWCRSPKGRLWHPFVSANQGRAYKQTGNLRAVLILLGHTKIESTVRYLGVDIEYALALSEGTEV